VNAVTVAGLALQDQSATGSRGAPPPLDRLVRLLAPIDLAARKTSRINIVLLSLTWIELVGLADYWSGPDRMMLIFYLIPITLATWYVGHDFGVLAAVLSITTSALADLAAGLPQVRYWNESVGLVSYLVFVSLLSRWRSLLNELDDRVRARTAALEAEVAERVRLQKEMGELTERERRRLGHDLHDSLCQHLTGTALSAQILSAELASAENGAAKHAVKVVELIEAGIDLTRNLARGLFSPDLESTDLTAALEALALSTRERFCVECEFHQDTPQKLKFESAIATQLYRIAQEAVANAAKHARATRIVVELDGDDSDLTLNVFDNGMGFDANTTGVGLGLRMMRNGAESIGAQFSIARHSAGGTLLTCIYRKEQLS